MLHRRPILGLLGLLIGRLLYRRPVLRLLGLLIGRLLHGRPILRLLGLLVNRLLHRRPILRLLGLLVCGLLHRRPVLGLLGLLVGRLLYRRPIAGLGLAVVRLRLHRLTVLHLIHRHRIWHTAKALNGAAAAEGGTALVFDPALLVVGHIAGAADNNVIPFFKGRFAERTDLADIFFVHSALLREQLPR